MNILHVAKWGSVILSALFCALGILLIASPAASAALLCAVTGGLLIACGVVKILGYFSGDPYRLAFQFDLAMGVLYIIGGLAMLLHPQELMAFLWFSVGLIVLADALLKIQTAIDAKRFGLPLWWLIGAAAVATSLPGALLVLHPTESMSVMMALAGIALMAEGIQSLWLVLYTVKGRYRDSDT